MVESSDEQSMYRELGVKVAKEAGGFASPTSVLRH